MNYVGRLLFLSFLNSLATVVGTAIFTFHLRFYKANILKFREIEYGPACSYLLCDCLKTSSDITRSCTFCIFSKESWDKKSAWGLWERGRQQEMGKVTGCAKQGKSGRVLGCNDQAMPQRWSDLPCIAFLAEISSPFCFFSYCSYNNQGNILESTELLNSTPIPNQDTGNSMECLPPFFQDISEVFQNTHW